MVMLMMLCLCRLIRPTTFKPDSTHTVAKQANGTVTSTYDGSSLNLTTNYTYDG